MRAKATLLTLIELIAVLASAAFLCAIYPWDDVLAKTVTAGGDTASHFFPTKIMHEVLLPNLQITGWTMGNYAGFPVFHFYSTLPFFAIAALGYVIPLEIAFKLVTLIGPTTLPLAAAYLFWAQGYRRGGPVLAAASVLPFLFQQGNSMWGGNIPSVLAGEFCHAIGLALSLVYAGHLHRLARGQGSWVASALLLAVIGLSHAFAFIGALWFGFWYLRPRLDGPLVAPRLFPAFLAAALLLAFWGIPVLPRVQFTTEWTMIWNIRELTEVVPPLLWPAAGLSAVNVLLMAVRIKAYRSDRQGFMLYCLFGSVVLYAVSPITGFPDIRFVPIGQIFVGLLAADFLVWTGQRLRFPLLYASIGLLASMGWAYQHIGYVPSWLTWNYSGYERKPAWPLFHEINEHVRGDINSPRMVFEHSQAHNRFGSSRAFENLPLFSGRSTLEGVFHQVSPNSPYVFYIQSEASEKTSGPFHQYSYARLDPAAAFPHFRTYNVGTVVVVSEAARAAYDADARYVRTFSKDGYNVYDIPDAVTGYVVAATHRPVLYTGPDYRTAFYRWFKHPELLDVPLVPAELAGHEADERHPLRTDTIREIPREPYSGDCEVTTTLEEERLSFETSCPGRPHIVKVSYFPRWKTADGSPIDLVSPGFMLVTPTTSHFEMYYGRNALDWAALAASLLGLGWCLLATLNNRVARKTKVMTQRAIRPIYVACAGRVRWLSAGLAIAAIAASISVRYEIRDTDATYRQGQEAYRDRRFADVVSVFSEYVRDDRDTFKQATALLQLGVSYRELDQPELAIVALERLLFDFPNINYGATGQFHLAAAYESMGETERAKKSAATLLRKYGGTPWAARLKKEFPRLVPSDEPPS